MARWFLIIIVSGLFFMGLALISQPGLVVSSAAAATAGRVYLIDQQNPANPAEISVAHAEGTNRRVMRTPQFDVPQSAESSVARSSQPKPEGPRQAVQQFRPRAVVGRTSNPRVAFDEKRLRIERVEQPFSIDFIERALEALPPEF